MQCPKALGVCPRPVIGIIIHELHVKFDISDNRTLADNQGCCRPVSRILKSLSKCPAAPLSLQERHPCVAQTEIIYSK